MDVMKLLMDGFSAIEVKDERVVTVRINRRHLRAIEKRIEKDIVDKYYTKKVYSLWGAEVLVRPVKNPVIVGEFKNKAMFDKGMWILRKK